MGRASNDRLSLTISTLSGDYDPQATTLANRLHDALELAGIDVELALRPHEEFYREILLDHDFDLAVYPHPIGRDPDDSYATFHSTFGDEWGWQNPFGFYNLDVDDYLEAQRVTVDEDRHEAIREALRRLTNEQPVVPICHPTEPRLAATDRFDGWSELHFEDRWAYLSLSRTHETEQEVRLIVTDTRPTKNLNPLAVEYRGLVPVIDLVYDSLGSYDGSTVVPWLADAWEFDDGLVTVELRSATWHDGETVTASDVAFTYEFLADTSLGNLDIASPAPIYRGRATMFEAVEAIDDSTVHFSTEAGRAAVKNAFTVPVLPEHIWIERTGEESIAGVEITEGVTEATVTDNVPPVGSGPFEYVDRTEREWLELERVDSHFSRQASDLPEAAFETVRFLVEPSTPGAIEAIESGAADGTVSPLDPGPIEEATLSSVVTRFDSPAQYVYVIGFNIRTEPMGNPLFRKTVAQLIDKAVIVDEVFSGLASPATALLPEWTPADLEWDDGDPKHPFLGASGELDESRVRTAFDEIGYRYDGEGNLLVRN